MALNEVHGFLFFYWIVRDTATTSMPFLSFGWVKELGGHWRRGKGIQIKFGKYITQVGVCKKYTFASEEDGTLNALEGRMLPTTIDEIGDWR